MTTRTCFGCGKEEDTSTRNRRTGTYKGGPFVQIRISERSLYICRGRLHTPSKSCMRAAFYKLWEQETCFACGAENATWDGHWLCPECGLDRKYGQEHRLEDSKTRDKLVHDVIAQVISALHDPSRLEDVFVSESHSERVRISRKIRDAIRQIIAGAKAEGRIEGERLLKSLATGKMGTLEFDAIRRAQAKEIEETPDLVKKILGDL